MSKRPLFSSSSFAMVCAFVLVVATVASGGCGGDKQPADTGVEETVDTKDTSAPDVVPDVDPNATVCCPVGNCADSTKACVSGACVPKKTADGCYFDGECQGGKTCVGETFCACGTTDCVAVAGTCSYGDGCCSGDGDCSGGATCEAGTCKPAPATGCWRDSQCGTGEVCEGAVATPCGAASASVVGHCAKAGVCCIGDAECGDGVCRGGRCLAKPADIGGGACWADGDCSAGDTCLGESLCACASLPNVATCVIPSTPGRCGKAADSCCSKDLDCGANQLCVEGKCGALPDRAKDECWVDGHCGVGRVCDGAKLCGCNEDGCTSDTIGQCQTLAIACDGDVACPQGMHCIAPDTAVCLVLGPDGGTEVPAHSGVCVETVDQGCWEKSDCALEMRCGAEEVCRNPAGCDFPNHPGECRELVKRWDCCDSHNECDEGYECRNQDSSITCPPSSSAVCLDKAIPGESCWNVDDCPTGLACSRVWICGCNGKCYFNRIGSCEVPTNCQTNLDCGEGYICALDPECFASPCTTAATCSSGGTCQEKVEGGCWSHSECGAGKYCEGLKICPSDTTCTLPDQPGICADRAKLGECCTSFKGCEPGLRCLSPAERGGCKIDHTSVCVPAVTPGASCFGDDDCDNQQRCEGAHVCPCGVETCSDEPSPGLCVPK